MASQQPLRPCSSNPVFFALAREFKLQGVLRFFHLLSRYCFRPCAGCSVYTRRVIDHHSSQQLAFLTGIFKVTQQYEKLPTIIFRNNLQSTLKTNYVDTIKTVIDDLINWHIQKVFNNQECQLLEALLFLLNCPTSNLKSIKLF